jgi:hypothetical protein
MPTTPRRKETDMADPAPDPETGVEPDRRSGAGTPRWVKVFGTVVAVVVLLFIIVLLTGGPGGHGPGRHTQSGGSGARTAPASVVDDRGSFAGPVGPALPSSGHASP